MRILALDIATTVGWAVSGGPSGIKSFQREAKDFGRLGVAFQLWLGGMIKHHRPGLVAIEAPFMRGPSTYHLMGLCFAAHTVASFHGLPRREVPPRKLKKFATDNGNAKKPAMVAAVQAWGFDVTDHNEADAIAVLAWAHAGAGEPITPLG